MQALMPKTKLSDLVKETKAEAQAEFERLLGSDPEAAAVFAAANGIKTKIDTAVKEVKETVKETFSFRDEGETWMDRRRKKLSNK